MERTRASALDGTNKSRSSRTWREVPTFVFTLISEFLWTQEAVVVFRAVCTTWRRITSTPGNELQLTRLQWPATFGPHDFDTALGCQEKTWNPYPEVMFPPFVAAYWSRARLEHGTLYLKPEIVVREGNNDWKFVEHHYHGPYAIEPAFKHCASLKILFCLSDGCDEPTLWQLSTLQFTRLRRLMLQCGALHTNPELNLYFDQKRCSPAALQKLPGVGRFTMGLLSSACPLLEELAVDVEDPDSSSWAKSVEVFAHLCKLTLTVGNFSVQRNICDFLARCVPSLSYLSLRSIHREDLAFLPCMPKLRHLYLEGTETTDLGDPLDQMPEVVSCRYFPEHYGSHVPTSAFPEGYDDMMRQFASTSPFAVISCLSHCLETLHIAEGMALRDYDVLALTQPETSQLSRSLTTLNLGEHPYLATWYPHFTFFQSLTSLHTKGRGSTMDLKQTLPALRDLDIVAADQWKWMSLSRLAPDLETFRLQKLWRQEAPLPLAVFGDVGRLKRLRAFVLDRPLPPLSCDDWRQTTLLGLQSLTMADCENLGPDVLRMMGEECWQLRRLELWKLDAKSVQIQHLGALSASTTLRTLAFSFVRRPDPVAKTPPQPMGRRHAGRQSRNGFQVSTTNRFAVLSCLQTLTEEDSASASYEDVWERIRDEEKREKKTEALKIRVPVTVKTLEPLLHLKALRHLTLYNNVFQGAVDAFRSVRFDTVVELLQLQPER